MTPLGRLMAALPVVLALAAAAGCEDCSVLTEGSRSWSTPLGSVDCGAGASIALKEDGEFLGGETHIYLFDESMSYRTAGRSREFDRSGEDVSPAMARLAARGLATDLHRPADGRPSWAVRIPERIPEKDYRRIADCLKRKHLALDAILAQKRAPYGEPTGMRRRYPRLAYVIRDDAEFSLAEADEEAKESAKAPPEASGR